jgi:hypothetical protein
MRTYAGFSPEQTVTAQTRDHFAPSAIHLNERRRTRSWDSLHPWLRAGIVGVASLTGALVVYWLLWEYWVNHPQTSAADDLGLQFLFGIVIAAFATVLIAGTLGYRAHNQSDLDLSTAAMPLKLTAAAVTGSERPNSLLGARPARIALSLANSTSQLETWFRVSIELPVLVPIWQEFPPSDDPVDRALFLAWVVPQRLNEDADAWSLEIGSHGSSAQISATFQSNGNAAIFPYSSTRLCTLSLPTEHFRSGQSFSCRYRVESGHAAPVEDTLVIGM